MILGHKRATFLNTMLNIIFYMLLLILINVKVTFLVWIFSLLSLTLYYIYNIYSMENSSYKIKDFVRSISLNLGLFVVFFISNKKEMSYIFVVMFIFQNIMKLLLFKMLIKDKNIILIGKNNDAETIKKILKEKNIYDIVAELSFSELSLLSKLIKKKSVHKIIITEELIKESNIKRILDMKLMGIQVFDYLTFYEKIEEKIIVNRIDESWLLYEDGFNILHDNLQKRLKRVFDFILAILIGIATLPIMIIAAIIVRLESSGPILFKQKRIGIANEEFTIIKFRSMRIHDPSKYSRYAQEKDARITKFGKFMRKTRIDELPQLWNILTGEMSFVGPRAEWNELGNKYAEKIPYYNIRHSVKPGLTGWAQVKYPYGTGVEDALKKLEYDLFYIKNQSFILDMMIMFKTAKIVVFGKGR